MERRPQIAIRGATDENCTHDFQKRANEALTLMRQIRILFLSAPFIFAITAVLISTVAVSGQQERAATAPPQTSFTGNPASSLTPVDFG